jgi:hypothetical protein
MAMNMRSIFNSVLFSPKNKKNEPISEPAQEEKHFAVVHGGQGRMEVIIEDNFEKLREFLYAYCQNPQEMEAMGTCNKNGVIQMTNPDKFDRKWLNSKIRNRMTTFKEMFFGR